MQHNSSPERLQNGLTLNNYVLPYINTPFLSSIFLFWVMRNAAAFLFTFLFSRSVWSVPDERENGAHRNAGKKERPDRTWRRSKNYMRTQRHTSLLLLSNGHI